MTIWPTFAEGKESYMIFGDRIEAGTALRKKQLDFLTDFSANLRSHGSVTSTGGSR